MPQRLRIPLLFAVLMATAFLASAVAPASGKTIKSEVDILTADGSLADATVYGTVDSLRGECQSRRKIKLFGFIGGDRTLLDTAFSSRNGAWGAHMKASEIQAATKLVAVMKSKRFGRHHHRKRCSADRDVRTI